MRAHGRDDISRFASPEEIETAVEADLDNSTRRSFGGFQEESISDPLAPPPEEN